MPEQQAQISGAEIFEALFAWFNGQITVIDGECIHETYKKANYGYYQCAACDTYVNSCVEATVDGVTVTRCFTALSDAINYALATYETATVKCLFGSSDGDDTITITGTANHTLTLDMNGCGQKTMTITVNGPDTFVFNIQNSTNISSPIASITVNSGNVNIDNEGCIGNERYTPGLYVNGGTVKLYRGHYTKIVLSNGQTVASLLPSDQYKFWDNTDKWNVDTTVGTLEDAYVSPNPLVDAKFTADSPKKVSNASSSTWSVEVTRSKGIPAKVQNNEKSTATWSYKNKANGAITNLGSFEIDFNSSGQATASCSTILPTGTYTLTCVISCCNWPETKTVTIDVKSSCLHLNTGTNGICPDCDAQIAAVVLDKNKNVVAYYESLEDAHQATATGYTLRLLQDAELNSAIDLHWRSANDATLDLNGHNVTKKTGASFLYCFAIRAPKSTIIGPGSVYNMFDQTTGGVATLSGGAKVKYASLSMMGLLTVKDAEIENLTATTDIEVIHKDAKLGTVTVGNDTFKMSAGTITNKLEIKNQGKASLTGGFYTYITIDSSATKVATVGDLLADGYAYKTQDDTYYAKDCTLTSLSNVTVVRYSPSQTFTVADGADNVEYDPETNTYTINVTYGDDNIDLDQIFSAQGTVTYELQNPGAADTAVSKVTSESGYVLSIRKAGSATVIATAAATNIYKETTTTIYINVAKAMPNIPSNLTAVYGEKLSTVNLPDGWAWVNAEQVVTETPSNEATYPFKANYTPEDTENYETLTNYDLEVKVIKGTLNNINIGLTNSTIKYGDDVPFTKSGVPGGATVKYYYRLTSNDEWTELAENQKLAAGTYYVKAEVSADNYEKWEGTQMELTIRKAELSITGVTAVDRQYEAGNTTVELTGGTLAGVIGEDEVGFDLKTGDIGTDALGSDRPVTTNITLTGEDKDNYTLTQPTGLTVTIFCNHVTEDEDYICDTCNQQLVAKIGTKYYTTLPLAVEAAVNGDTIEILCDITVESVVRIAKKVTITSVDSANPYKITTATDNHGYLLSTETNGDVTLTNIIVDGGSQRNLTAQRAAIAVDGGKLTVSTGAKIQNNKNIGDKNVSATFQTVGGGICVLSGELAVNGGTIVGNYAYFGGGIGMVDGTATVTAESGSITGNNAVIGGGICVWENHEVDLESGQVRPTSTGILHIGGGISVKENHATDYAGGINCHWGKVYVSGHPYLAGNTASGNAYNAAESNSGIYLDGKADGYSPVILEGALTEGAVISFYSWFGTDGILISNPAEGYTITETDLSRMSYEDDAYYLALINGSVVLKAKSAPTGTAPEALTLTYNGSPQTLIEAGEYTGGTVYYRMGENGEWLQTLPSATAVGSYPIYWKVVADAHHTDLAPQLITAKINPQTISIDGNGGVNGEDGYSVIIDPDYDCTYDSTQKTPSVTILDKDGNTVSNNEYNVSYGENINAGTGYIFIADKEGGNYTVSGSTTFQISKADQNPTAAAVDAVYGDTDKVVAVSNAIGGLSYNVTDGADIVTVDETGKLTFLRAGSAVVTITAAGNNNYNDKSCNANITVSKKMVTVSALDKKAYTSGNAPDLSNPVKDRDYTISGMISGDVLDNSVIVNLAYESAPDMSQVGEYDIIPTVIGNDSRYSFDYVNGKLEVQKKSSRPSNPSSPSNPSKPDNSRPEFVDVPEGSYFEDAVDWAVDNGITTGISSTLFDPEGICTRAQAVTFLWRMSGCPAPNNSQMPFVDVAADSYYYDAVLWAVENGITVGTSENTFSPDENCSRAHIVTFLWRAGGKPIAAAENPFADVSRDAYYIDAVLWAVANGITLGTDAAAFSPDADCTRAQIVTFIYRAIQN